MTRFGIDATVAIRLTGDDATVAATHQLVGPALLRSEALSMLYRQVRANEMERGEARALLDRITTIRWCDEPEHGGEQGRLAGA